MKNRLSPATIIASFLFLIFSQTAMATAPPDTSLRKGMYLKSIALQYGLNSSATANGSYADFVKINAGFVLPQLIVDSAKHLHSLQSNSSAGFLANVGFGFGRAKPFGKGKFVPGLRLGLSYNNLGVLKANYANHDKYRIDTLTASSGLKIPVDSVWTRNRDYQYTSRNLSLDASLIFNSTSNPNVSAFFGIGLQAGASIQSTAGLTRFSNHRMDFHYPNEVISTSPNITANAVFSTETRAAKPGISFGVYVPLGLEFRLSKNHKLMKKMWLQAELRPSLSFTQIPELQRIIMNPGIYTGWGLKYNL